MKLPIPPVVCLRWLAHGTALIAAFCLGIHCDSGRLVVRPVAQAPRAPGKWVAPALLAAAPSAAAAPAAEVPLRATHSPAGPTQRLSRLIETAATLNEPQTIASLRRLDLQPEGLETKLERHVLLARFAEVDPQTAMTYVDTLSGHERDEQLANVLTTWASRDPQGAAAQFQTQSLNGGLASTEDRQTAASIAGEWARRDPSAALEWADSLPEEVRSEARARVVASVAAGNPAAAAQVAAHLPAGYERAEAMKPLAAQWAQLSPERTSVWVQTLAAPAEQASAASGLVSSWMSQDPMATSQWVANLKPGTARDAAVAAMVGAQSLRNDPEAATLWAASVQDPALRQQLVAETSGRWQRQDAQAASVWLQANAR